ncbi:MAG: glycerol kinase GlpK [Aestuariivita sp.]|nr:glycerol kinase GlpK [Aestuariivita sp.]
MECILAIDQGTTSSRAIVFDNELTPIASGQKEFPQYYPKNGWVEHNPEEIWESVLCSCRIALKQVENDPVAIGITNQRETVFVWEKETGKAIYNAIVWQDRRTTSYCNELKKQGHEVDISNRTGLLLDPYFSASKLSWILQNIPNVQQAAKRGELLFGTADSYLIWRLTGGRRHVTDITNASRTMLVNLSTGEWDEQLLDLFQIPRVILPEILQCADNFGMTDRSILGCSIPIVGVAGDQQAAAIGQACFDPGMVKATFGTGCFVLLNTGDERCKSKNRLLTTVACRISGKTTYAIEGSIFVAGAVVQWLRDGLGLIQTASESECLAMKADVEQQLYIVPAFTGLGAPYWDSECRGAIFGLTRNSGRNEFAKAALESVAYQTRDLLEAMRLDFDPQQEMILRVDGGMAVSDWMMQNLANQLDVLVDRPSIIETTALGVAYLAGFELGLYPAPSEFLKSWRLEKRFVPSGVRTIEDKRYRGWKNAVQRTLSSKIIEF